MRLVLGLLCICLAGLAYGAEPPVEILKVEGGISVSDRSGKESKPVQAGAKLPPGGVLSTGPNARAVVRVGADGVIVIGNNAQVEIGKTEDHVSFFRQVTGAIYYALNTVKGRRPIEVKTATATLGVRGTRFLVTETEARKEVGMRTGVVSVTSPAGEFELHRMAEQSEFEAYKREAQEAMDKQKREFEEYKAKTQQEFIEFKREFSLAANRMATFDGKRVVEKPLSEESKKDMESFEGYADEWLKQIHD